MKEPLIKFYNILKEDFSEINWLDLLDKAGGSILAYSLIFTSLIIGMIIGWKLVGPFIPASILYIDPPPKPYAFATKISELYTFLEVKLKQLDYWFLNRQLYSKVKLATIIYNVIRLSTRLFFNVFIFIFYTAVLFFTGPLLAFLLLGIVFSFDLMGTKHDDTISLAYSRAVGFYTFLGASPLLAKIWTYISGFLEIWGTFESAQSLKKAIKNYRIKSKK